MIVDRSPGVLATPGFAACGGLVTSASSSRGEAARRVLAAREGFAAWPMARRAVLVRRAAERQRPDGTRAMASISTRAPFGSAATWTVARAGSVVVKRFAYVSLTTWKSARSTT